MSNEASLPPRLGRVSTGIPGLAARPIGAIVCGHLGDKLGRRNLMLCTVSLMGLSSMLMGLLPTYASIGVYAPVLLVVLRILQGFALGGESTVDVDAHADFRDGTRAEAKVFARHVDVHAILPAAPASDVGVDAHAAEIRVRREVHGLERVAAARFEVHGLPHAARLSVALLPLELEVVLRVVDAHDEALPGA